MQLIVAVPFRMLSPNGYRSVRHPIVTASPSGTLFTFRLPRRGVPPRPNEPGFADPGGPARIAFDLPFPVRSP